MFFNDLTKLIVKYSWVRIWVLKIDDEFESRGIAYLDPGKLLSKKLLKLMNDHNQ